MRGSGGAESLDAGFRSHREWSEEAKRALIARGYAAADAELAAHGIDLMERAWASPAAGRAGARA